MIHACVHLRSEEDGEIYRAALGVIARVCPECKAEFDLRLGEMGMPPSLDLFGVAGGVQGHSAELGGGGFGEGVDAVAVGTETVVAAEPAHVCGVDEAGAVDVGAVLPGNLDDDRPFADQTHKESVGERKAKVNGGGGVLMEAKGCVLELKAGMRYDEKLKKKVKHSKPCGLACEPGQTLCPRHKALAELAAQQPLTKAQERRVPA